MCMGILYCLEMKLYVTILCLVIVLMGTLSPIAGEVVDVDIGLADNSYTYTADLDSQELEYRCVSSGSSGELTWKYNLLTYTNTFNAYEIYGKVRELGTYTIECLSGTNKLGEMELTFKDNANFTVEYSGTREVYPSSSGKIQTATIPLDTSDIRLTCEISRGVITTPSNLISPVDANPSVTIMFLNGSTGNYQCYRTISSSYIPVLILTIQEGAASTVTSPVTTNTSTTPTTIPTVTTPITTTIAPTLTSSSPSSTTTSSPTSTTTTTTTTKTTTTTPLVTTLLGPSQTTPSTYTAYTPSISITTSVPPSPLPNSMSSVIIGICILVCILLAIVAACVVMSFCLWRHYSGFQRRKYSKQHDTEHRNGSLMRELNPSPKHLQSRSYQPVPSQAPEATPRSIALEGYKSQMDVLWAGDHRLLTAEFTSLGQSELRYPTEAARDHITDGKNRYKNIYPYDRSRVRLLQRVEGSDYVNASYIPGLLVSEEFIAAQAPKKETMLEFWEMLWEKRVSNVVMLTKFLEGNKKKCEPYLPERAGDTIGVGDLLVTLLRVTSEYDQTTRHLEVKSKRDITMVLRMRHFHFLGWPDHEAPRHPQGLLNFIARVKKERLSDSSPMCVHCSAGVGRTGAFIAMYNLMEEIKKCVPFSIHRLVHDMREYRPHMVQTFTQYKFIYLSCLELMYGDTSIPSNEFCYLHATCLDPNPGILQTQLAEIDYFAEKSFSRSCSEALSPRNNSYNPDATVLPFDDYRPMLSTPAWGVGGYINASYVDGFRGFQDFIVTQHPNAFTARHTIQLIFQTECPLVVVLASPDEYAQMGYEHGRIVYWPEPTTQHEFEGYVLKNVSQLHGEVMEFILIDVSDSSQHRFHLIISLHWDTSGAAADPSSVLGIVNEIISAKANSPTKPIIVHCEDGAGKSGVLLAVYNAVTQVAEEGHVDIFQVVKCLRYCRPRMVNTLVQYISIHSVIQLYLAPNTYENLNPYRL